MGSPEQPRGGDSMDIDEERKKKFKEALRVLRGLDKNKTKAG